MSSSKLRYESEAEDESKLSLDGLISCLENFISSSQEQQERSNQSSTSMSQSQSISLEDQSSSAQDLADELLALKSIYTDENISLYDLNYFNRRNQIQNQNTTPPQPWNPEGRIRLSLTVELDSLTDSTSSSSPSSSSNSIRLSITLPQNYPNSISPPQFQLLSKYIGSYQVDSDLFGQILRLFLHDESNSNEIHWLKGQVILFEGIEKTREKVEIWLNQKKESQDSSKVYDPAEDDDDEEEDEELIENLKQMSIKEAEKNQRKLENDRKRIEEILVSAPPITEKKSIFIGHSARIQSLEDVSLIISYLQSDRKLSKASHPTIHAWVFKRNGIVHRDHDDDGESAAGGRLSHLLDILNLEDVIVVVTRFFGGVHLGSSRFSLINQAARSALEVLGVVEGPLNSISKQIHSNGNSKKSK